VSNVRILSQSDWVLNAAASSTTSDIATIPSGLVVPRGAHVLIVAGHWNYGPLPSHPPLRPRIITTAPITAGQLGNISVQPLPIALPAGTVLQRDTVSQTLTTTANAAGATSVSLQVLPANNHPTGSMFLPNTGRAITMPATFTETAFSGEWSDSVNMYGSWAAMSLWSNNGGDTTLPAIPIDLTGGQFSIQYAVKAIVLGGIDRGSAAPGPLGVNGPYTGTNRVSGVNSVTANAVSPGNGRMFAVAIAAREDLVGLGAVSVAGATVDAAAGTAPNWPIVAHAPFTAASGANQPLTFTAAGGAAVEQWLWATLSLDAATITDATARTRTSIGSTTITVGEVAQPLTGLGTQVRAVAGATAIANMGLVTGTGSRLRAAPGQTLVRRAGTGVTRLDTEVGTAGHWTGPDQSMLLGGGGRSSDFCLMPADGYLGGRWQMQYGGLEWTDERAHTGNLSMRYTEHQWQGKPLTEAMILAHPEMNLTWNGGGSVSDEAGGMYPLDQDTTVVPVPAYGAGFVTYQSCYFYLEEYPPADMGFFWFVDNYPSSLADEVTMIGMCPWGRFEIWSPFSGEVKTDTFVIPLDKWFRVDVRIDMGPDVTVNGGKFVARLYCDPEAPADQFDYEIVSGPGDPFRRASLADNRSIVVYQPLAWPNTVGGFQWPGNDGPSIVDLPQSVRDAFAPVLFDDFAVADGAHGWIGPSGNAVTQRSSHTTQLAVGTPTIALVDPEDPPPPPPPITEAHGWGALL